MAHLDQLPAAAPVAAIQRAARLGLFTGVDVELMIDRIRVLPTVYPAEPLSPDRTVS